MVLAASSRLGSPNDRAGLIAITRRQLTPDAKSYAYGYRRVLSELYMAEGLR
jgi:hypothetical protein